MQTKAKIYQPAKTAMQSGRGKTKFWLLEFIPAHAMTPEALMGWNSMGDTLSQISLKFNTREEAEAYAQAKQIAYEVHLPHSNVVPPKSYSANFAFTRRRAYDQEC